MKLTNNAIKFLVSQYRATFKKAYIKGLAHALCLTSSLAAINAHAQGEHIPKAGSGRAENHSDALLENAFAINPLFSSSSQGSSKTKVEPNALEGVAHLDGFAFSFTNNDTNAHNALVLNANNNSVALLNPTFSANLTLGENDADFALSNPVLNQVESKLDSLEALLENVLVNSNVLKAMGENKAQDPANVTLSSDDKIDPAAAAALKAAIDAAIKAYNESASSLSTNTNADKAQDTSAGSLESAKAVSSIENAEFVSADALAASAAGAASCDTNNVIGDDAFTMKGEKSASLLMGNHAVKSSSLEENSLGKNFFGVDEESITINSNKVISDTDAIDSTLVAGFAEGNSGAIASSNTLTIRGEDTIVLDSNSSQLIAGGQATSNNQNSDGNYIAVSNKLNIDGLSYNNGRSSAESFSIAGGIASTETGTLSKNITVVALDNKTELRDIDLSGMAAPRDILLTGNAAVATNSSADSPGEYSHTYASGSQNSGEANLKITNATLGNANTNEITLAGGYAYTTRGNAHANNNKVELINVEINGSANSDNNLYGGYANNIGAGVSSNGNSISLTTTDPVKRSLNNGNDALVVKGNVYGGYADVIIQFPTSNGDVTANGNNVVVGDGIRVEGDVIGGQLITCVGANFDLKTNVNVDNNKVTIYGDVVGNVLAASTDHGATTANGNQTLLIGANVSSGSLGGGQGINSLVSIDKDSTYTVSDDNNGLRRFISSDVVNIAGKVSVEESGKLDIHGFGTWAMVHDDDESVLYNSNLTTFTNTARVENAGLITLLGETHFEDGAVLKATKEGAELVVDSAPNKHEATDVNATTPIYRRDNDIGAEYGSLTLTANTLKSYLGQNAEIAVNTTAATTTNTTACDSVESQNAAGILVLKNDTILDFAAPEAVLSDFNFDNKAGAINVEGNATVRGDNVVVKHKLAVDASVDRKDLVDADVSPNIKLDVNNLTLGSNDLSVRESAELKFNKITAHKDVNFITDSMVQGKTKDGSSLSAFELNDNTLVLDAKKTHSGDSTNYQYEDDSARKFYYTKDSGKLTGNVRLTNGSTLDVANGDWEQQDAIILTDGTSLNVGASSTDKNYVDASLSVKNGLVLESTANATINVNVSGEICSNAAQMESKTASVANAVSDAVDNVNSTKNATSSIVKTAVLDLRGGLVVNNNGSDKSAGVTNFNLANGASLLLNGDDVNTLFKNSNAQSNTGVFFKASNQSNIEIEGTVDANFSDISGKDDSKFQLSKNSSLSADVLNLTKTDKNSGNLSDSTYQGELNFNGTVTASELNIKDNTKTTGSTSAIASKVALNNSTVVVKNKLNVTNNELIVGADEKASLSFSADKSTDDGTINLNKLSVKNGIINVTEGAWDASNTVISLNSDESSLVIGSASENSALNSLNDEKVATLQAKALNATNNAQVLIHNNGSATFETADFSGLTKANSVLISGNLTINGVTNTYGNFNGFKFGADGSIKLTSGGLLTLGKDATKGVVLDNGIDPSYTSITINNGYGKIANDGGMLYLSLDAGNVFSAQAIVDLKKKLFTANSLGSDNVLINGGILNIGDASYVGLDVKDDGDGTYTAKWKSQKVWQDVIGNVDSTNNMLGKTDVIEIESNDEVYGHFGSFTLDASAASDTLVKISKNSSLRFSQGNNGFYISDATDSEARGALIRSGLSLKLMNGGKASNIVLESGANDTDKLTFLQTEGSGLSVLDSVFAKNSLDAGSNHTLFNVLGKTEVKGDISDIETLNVANDLSANNIKVAKLNASDAIVKVDNLSLDNGSLSAASLTAEEAFTLKSSNSAFTVTNNGSVKAKNISVLGDSALLRIGADVANSGSTNNESLSNVGSDNVGALSSNNSVKTTGESTGYLETSLLDLGQGATLYVESNYANNISYASVLSFTEEEEKTAYDLGLLQGDVALSKNVGAAFGATREELNNVLASYKTQGKFEPNYYGTILYLNGQLDMADGSSLALNAKSQTKSLEDVRSVLKNDAYPNLKADLGLSQNSLIIFDEKSFENANGQKQETAIHFNKTNAVVNNEGGDFILKGSFDTSDKLNFFQDNDAAAGESGCGIKLIGKPINIYSENGFIFATIELGDDVGYGVGIQAVDKETATAVMHDASFPVIDTLVSYVDRNHNEEKTETPSTDNIADNNTNENVNNNSATNSGTTENDKSVALVSADESAQPVEAYKHYDIQTSAFLDKVVTTTTGSPAETIARFGNYGGIVHATIKAGLVNSDAISERFGIGSSQSEIKTAENGNTTLWLAPVYKKLNYDGLSAQGLNYGLDLNLYGLSLGSDYALNDNLLVGAAVSVGSGDASGKGNKAAQNVNNDFNFFGFSLYGAYVNNNFTIASDISYTAVRNDVSATTELDNFSRDLNTSNLSFGVNGKYEFNFENFDLTPHAGIRFSHVNLDDFTLASATDGEIAHVSAQNLDVINIPVGITLGKTFTTENVVIKPMLDLNITAKLGDTDAKSNIHWAGAKGFDTGVSTEIIDGLTYGSTFGLTIEGASYSINLGVNYTGSRKSNEYGATLQASYTF